MTRAMIKILLADDQRLVRAGFRSILEDEDDFEVVGEAGDGEQALSACRTLHPDVVLMDIRMPGVDGLQATRQIAGDPRLDGIKVVILTTFDLDDYVYGALRAGATGFLVKDTEPEELVHAVRVAARGDALISPSVTRRLIAEFAVRVKAPEPGPRLKALTDREREVMELVAAGLTNDEIAARLVLSPATAKTHVSRIMTKVDARDRSQLVVLAYESGMVRPGWLTGRPPTQ
jgi:DNA-binding NarL/FixJ family response regulator